MSNPPGSDEKKAQVQDYFSRTAESYVASFSHRTGSDLQRLIELGEWHSQQQALDIATGGGHTALAVAPHVAQIMVTDLTPLMLEKARAFLLAQGVTNAQSQVVDAEQLPFPAASFDRVTCRIAAEAVDHESLGTHHLKSWVDFGGDEGIIGRNSRLPIVAERLEGHRDRHPRLRLQRDTSKKDGLGAWNADRDNAIATHLGSTAENACQCVLVQGRWRVSGHRLGQWGAGDLHCRNRCIGELDGVANASEVNEEYHRLQEKMLVKGHEDEATREKLVKLRLSRVI